jgi:hypothetical protein
LHHFDKAKSPLGIAESASSDPVESPAIALGWDFLDLANNIVADSYASFVKRRGGSAGP